MSGVPDLPLPRGIVHRQVEVPGGPLTVLDTGVDGPTVVLVPGFTGSKEDFRFLLEPLAAAGIRGIAVDQRGQYESPGPDEPGAYTVDALAADLLALVAALDVGPVHAVGHSFGGLVCRAAVLKEPTAFLSLVLMGSGPSALTGRRADAMPFMRQILQEHGLLAVWQASQALPTAKAQPPDVLAFLEKRFLAGAPAALLGMGDALTSEPDRVDELAALGIDVLVMYGEADDAWLPHQQDEMADRLGAPVVVVPASIHSPAAENPTYTAQELIRWIR
jgi:pimeloyl-ACP methyl ester carboxylesterase